jgi:deltex
MQIGDKDNLRCAVCSQIYGILTGKMPPGEMRWRLTPKNNGFYCDGYENFGVWTIQYHFPNGKGKNPYRGTSRTAYLPDTDEGRTVLALLVKAFERRHTFIVGDSVTTGQKNCVVWSGIHHKSNTHGGSSCFGFPDPTYFNRVMLELADRGVTLETPEEVSKIVNNSTGNRIVM